MNWTTKIVRDNKKYGELFSDLQQQVTNIENIYEYSNVMSRQMGQSLPCRHDVTYRACGDYLHKLHLHWSPFQWLKRDLKWLKLFVCLKFSGKLFQRTAAAYLKEFLPYVDMWPKNWHWHRCQKMGIKHVTRLTWGLMMRTEAAWVWVLKDQGQINWGRMSSGAGTTINPNTANVLSKYM